MLGLIFNTINVKKILQNQKMQTRRPVKARSRYSSLSGLVYLKETYTEIESKIIYKADLPENEWYRFKWKPSLFMPQIYSRIYLDIVEKKQEGLQDISEEDAWSEGCSSIQEFKELWDTLYKKTEFRWSNNPMVWKIGFIAKRVKIDKHHYNGNNNALT